MTGSTRQYRQRIYFDLIGIALWLSGVYLLSSQFDFLEWAYITTREHEELELDEFIPVVMSLSLALIYFLWRRWTSERILVGELQVKNKELNSALSEVKLLQGIIPICCNCKKIRDEDGYWQQVESYVSAHSRATFTHGICDTCRSLLYPELEKD